MNRGIDPNSRYFVVLGISGHGKSSFINAISGTNSCHVSNKGESDTQDFKSVEFVYNKLNYVGIDTPGLEDSHDNNEKINRIKTLLNKYPFVRNIIIIKRYDEVRFLKCFQDSLKVFMETFPLKNFWKHVIIVNTRAIPSDEAFQDFLEEGPPSFLDNLLANENMKKIMKEKNINIPTEIKEFFIDSKKLKKYPDIEKQFDEIKEIVDKSLMMFDKIIPGQKNKEVFIKEDKNFKYYEKYDELICIDFNKNKNIIKLNLKESAKPISHSIY
jgi:hypothetical protein